MKNPLFLRDDWSFRRFLLTDGSFADLTLVNFGNLASFILLEVFSSHPTIGICHLHYLMHTAVFILKYVALVHIFGLVIPLVGFVLFSLAVYPFLDLVDAAVFIIAF